MPQGFPGPPRPRWLSLRRKTRYPAPAYRAEHIIGSGSGASLSRRGMLGAAGLLAAAGLADLIRVSGKSSPARVASDRRALSRLLTGTTSPSSTPVSTHTPSSSATHHAVGSHSH